jgi:hypothetical protein
MLTRAEGRRQRREIMQQIAREHRREQRELLTRLRQEIRDARAMRAAALRQAKERCRADRLAARARARELRARLMQELREAVRRERAEALTECKRGLEEARAISDKVARARAELEAERRYRRDMRRIESGNRQRVKEAKRASRADRRGESDDEVVVNIPPELVPLWEKVKRSIRGSERKSRLEEFMLYVENHPSEYLEAMEDRTEVLIRELEQKERDARRALRRAPPREVFADVTPF